MQLQAVFVKEGFATLSYIAEYQKYQLLGVPTIQEFLNSYSYEEIVGSEGTSLSPEDEILCSDGILLGSEILE